MASYISPFQPQPYLSNEHLGLIEFRHPGYPPPHNLLLRIARVDRSAVTEPLGVHLGTAPEESSGNAENQDLEMNDAKDDDS